MSRKVMVAFGTLAVGLAVAATVSGRGTGLRPNLGIRRRPTVDTELTST